MGHFSVTIRFYRALYYKWYQVVFHNQPVLGNCYSTQLWLSIHLQKRAQHNCHIYMECDSKTHTKHRNGNPRAAAPSNVPQRQQLSHTCSTLCNPSAETISQPHLNISGRLPLRHVPRCHKSRQQGEL